MLLRGRERSDVSCTHVNVLLIQSNSVAWTCVLLSEYVAFCRLCGTVPKKQVSFQKSVVLCNCTCRLVAATCEYDGAVSGGNFLHDFRDPVRGRSSAKS